MLGLLLASTPRQAGRERVWDRLQSKELCIVQQRLADWKPADWEHWARHITRAVLRGSMKGRMEPSRQTYRFQHRESAEPFWLRIRRIGIFPKNMGHRLPRHIGHLRVAAYHTNKSR